MMPWVRLDDQFTDHPKVIQVGPLAECLFVRGLTYASRYLTDGFVPLAHLRRMGDLDGEAEAAKLVAAGLWTEAEGGFQIHDYLEYQPSAEKVKAERDANAKRQAAWRERHHGETASPASESQPSNDVSNGVSNGPVTGAPSRTHPRTRPENREPVPAAPAPSAPPPTADTGHKSNGKRNDGPTYALVDAFAVATKRRPNQLQGRDRSEVAAAFRPYAEDASPEDVIGCVAFMRSDPFWREPGKLTARKVASTLPEWIAAGRPERAEARASPSANGNHFGPKGPDAAYFAKMAADLEQQGL